MKWKHSERYSMGNTIAIIENRFKQYRSHRRAERTRPVAVHAVVVLHVLLFAFLMGALRCGGCRKWNNRKGGEPIGCRDRIVFKQNGSNEMGRGGTRRLGVSTVPYTVYGRIPQAVLRLRYARIHIRTWFPRSLDGTGRVSIRP